jgi:hypothetical protein
VRDRSELQQRLDRIVSGPRGEAPRARTHPIVRKSEESSVVRKPALKPADLTSGDEPGPDTELSTWCDCGWPYTMLLPRSTKKGMAFRSIARSRRA